MKRLSVLVIGALIATTPAVAAAERPDAPAAACPVVSEYDVAKLPGIPSDFSEATEGFELNDAGVAVGSAFAVTPALAWRAVRWAPGATEPEVLTGGMGRADGVAENGVAAGEDDLDAATWKPAGGQTTLRPRRGHGRGAAQDVNGDGVVVGWSSTDTDIFPVAWVDRRPLQLANGVPDAFGGLMRRISEAGLAVGEMSFFAAPFERGVIWNAETREVTILPGLIGFGGAEGDSTALGINERGLVVGQSHLPRTGGEAAIIPVTWRNGRARALNVGTFNGGTASDVNDCGAVVGEGFINVFDVRAVIWQGGAAQDLNGLHDGPPLGLTSAVSINNAGQILVNGSGATYILTPAT